MSEWDAGQRVAAATCRCAMRHCGISTSQALTPGAAWARATPNATLLIKVACESNT